MKDIVIVGGGISGLYLADKLKSKFKDVTLFEKKDLLGGRVKTITHNKDIYEAGAARFHKNHTLLIELIKKFKLEKKMIELPSKWSVIPQHNKGINFKDVHKLIKYLVKKSKKYTKEELRKITVEDLCNKELGSNHTKYLFDNYPYYSELSVLNCENAINMLDNDLSEENTFYVLAGGLTQIINNLEKSFKKNNGKIFLEHSLEDIKYDKISRIFTLTFNNLGKEKIIKTNKLICALDKTSLDKINFLNKNIKYLNSLQCQPLLRIYQKYPVKNGKSWFSDLGKVVTPFNKNKLKFFIPINPEKGLVMTTYTDGKYTDYWYDKIKDGTHEVEVMKEVRKLFKNIKIPDPNYTKVHYWINGACYWKKGKDSIKINKKMIKPLDINLYICGDSFSLRQAWQEGALETSNQVYNKIILQKKTIKIKKHKGGKKSQKLKSITKEELSKAKKKYWIAIDGIVYDVKPWLKDHPGGSAILKSHSGKDATQMFRNFHSFNPSKILVKSMKKVEKVGKLI